MERVLRSEHITDLYVTGTRLRLREAVPVGGGKPMRRLGRKADVEPAVRLLTSIYLSDHEFELLSVLPGHTLKKTRHYLGIVAGTEMSVDVFEGPLNGLVLAEAEFNDRSSMDSYPAPEFSSFEVTNDLRYTGGELVLRGLPMSD